MSIKISYETEIIMNQTDLNITRILGGAKKHIEIEKEILEGLE